MSDGDRWPARQRVARAVFSRAPSFRGRGRLAALAYLGTPDPRSLFESERGRVLVPEGEVLPVRHGLRFRFFRDGMYLHPYFFGEYEPALSRILAGLVEPGDSAIDVGANFGWYTNLLAQRVGEDGTIHAFEPVPSLAGLLADSVDLNGHRERVRVNQAALGAQSGDITIYTFAGLPHGHASSTPLGRRDATPHVCSLTTLDDYFERLPDQQIALVKIDVEGHELDVLQGAKRLLGRRDAPIVSFEVNMACLTDRGIAPQQIADHLRLHGYTFIWRIAADGRADRVTGTLPEVNGDYLAATPEGTGRLRRALGRRAESG